MLKNYLLVAFRNLLKNRVFSFVNIGGLAVGIAVAMLIGLWIHDELSFNKYHKNYDRIARVMQNQTFNGSIETTANQAMQVGPELRNTYGNNFKYVVTAAWPGSHLLSFDEKKMVKTGNYMEPEVTEMLSLNMLRGSRNGLNDLNSILLSETAARSFFGDTDPVGKIIKINNRQDVKVTGVYQDLPDNSSFADLAFIAPWQLLVKSDNLESRVGWGNNWFQTIVQIADNADMATVSANIKNAKLNRIDGEYKTKYKPTLFLHPMNRWHLYGQFKDGVNAGGAIEYVWLFGIIGIFVLLLACINFMNLSTARSEKRAKEVGIRKAIGSIRLQLIGQFFSESLLVVMFSFVISLLLIQLLLPLFNEISGKKLSVLWKVPAFWLMSIGFALATGLIAGSYPAIYLSSFQPVKVLKGTFKAGRLAAIPRKVLVVVQFTVSITLIIGTLIVLKQIQFAKSRPVGYNRNGLVTVPIKTQHIIDHYAAFRTDLLNTGVIEEVAATDCPVTQTSVTNSGFSWQGKDPQMAEEFVTLRVEPEFGKMVSWQIKEGRDFSRDFATDTAAFILNEAAVKYMGLKDPVGQLIKWGDDETFKVIGVVKDLVTQSPYEPIKQTIFLVHHKRLNFTNIKIKANVNAGEALARIEAVFKKYDPANPFEYSFADLEYDKKFRNEERIGALAGVFAALTIFISCLGLFGLAAFVAEQRTREIGIRKVLGASVLNVWQLLSKEFVILIIISCFIAAPVAYHFLHEWLQQYEYRTRIEWWVFAVAGLGAIAITLLVVSYQSIKAALMNPVKSLKTV